MHAACMACQQCAAYLHQLQCAVASLAEHHEPHSSCGASCKRSCSVAAPDWQVAVSRLRIWSALACPRVRKRGARRRGRNPEQNSKFMQR